MKLESYINEPFEFEAEIDKYFHPTDPIIVFDIGACEGEDSIKFKLKFPNATVYSFEPLPANIKKIKKHFKQFSVPANNVYQLALSDKAGKSNFYISSGHPESVPKEKNWDYGNKSSSLLPPKEHKKIHQWVKFNKKIPVKTVRLDSFCKTHSIDRIDIVWLDVQGAELMVLQGAGKFISNISFVWLEVEAVELYKNQPLKNDVEKFMESHGFSLIKDTVEGVAGDQLYINKKMLKEGNAPIHRRIFEKIKRRGNRAQPISIGDSLKMIVPDDMIWSFNEGSYYEKNVLFWLQKLSKQLNGPVFFDIGANYGFYALKLSSLCKYIHAFEPVGSTYSVLRKNIKKNKLKNVIAHNIAISNKSGLGHINIYSSSGNNSAYSRDIPADHPLKFVGKEKIALQTLTDSMKDNNLPAPGLIKIDVEGAEMDVLNGAFNFIKREKPVIVVEYSIATSKDAGYNRIEILRILQSANYTVYGLSANPDDLNLYSPTTKKVKIDNLIATPKKMELKTQVW